jgi:hypothetical protein
VSGSVSMVWPFIVRAIEAMQVLGVVNLQLDAYNRGEVSQG